MVPQSLQLSVFAASSSSSADVLDSGTMGAGVGLAARAALGVCGLWVGMAGWNCAPLARPGDGALPFSSSVTDLMNASSSCFVTSIGVACGLGAGVVRGA